MVQYSPGIEATFHALADPTRRALVERLTRKGLSVSELARPFEMSLPAIQKHLRVLEDAGLVSSRKQGRVRVCQLEVRELDRAAAWIDKRRTLWSRRLDALSAHLNEEKKR